jgi:chromosomal replication initiation ATPase DnaA
MFRQIPRRTLPHITVADCRKIVGEHYFIPKEVMCGKGWHWSVARPRMMAMTLAREVTGHSFPYIGQCFGGKDHSTVINAQQRTYDMVSKHVELQNAIEHFRTKLRELSEARVQELAARAHLPKPEIVLVEQVGGSGRRYHIGIEP